MIVPELSKPAVGTAAGSLCAANPGHIYVLGTVGSHGMAAKVCRARNGAAEQDITIPVGGSRVGIVSLFATRLGQPAQRPGTINPGYKDVSGTLAGH